ncbi:MAG: large-conductance mechanosensitive channel protein MscL [Ignavibacteriales bacterium]|nr:large-conductance mechanosensitive channel protein MscL [Ignavibacteriales bacterium]MCF8306823.1 large-conductance mechanosensitive channel protein MscL [Ignavibacteriales bacterium]MCF8316778.1 large-conductance mechanosensitive channel protein MscL [Ignavibacteriales bacterium]MCF8438082.1 large-conductance mechanosensitive channel protein MscL [Ignavibacteriales bacterium]
MIQEFKKFIMRGNVLDLAVAVIIGGAFGKIVSSFVADIIMPPLGLLMGNMDFANLFIVLSGGEFATLAEAKAAGAATLNYGVFLTFVLDFLIVAFAIFMLIKASTKLKKAEATAPAPAPTTKECPHCFTQIPIKASRCPNCTSTLE